MGCRWHTPSQHQNGSIPRYSPAPPGLRCAHLWRAACSLSSKYTPGPNNPRTPGLITSWVRIVCAASRVVQWERIQIPRSSGVKTVIRESSKWSHCCQTSAHTKSFEGRQIIGADWPIFQSTAEYRVVLRFRCYCRTEREENGLKLENEETRRISTWLWLNWRHPGDVDLSQPQLRVLKNAKSYYLTSGGRYTPWRWQLVRWFDVHEGMILWSVYLRHWPWNQCLQYLRISFHRSGWHVDCTGEIPCESERGLTFHFFRELIRTKNIISTSDYDRQIKWTNVSLTNKLSSCRASGRIGWWKDWLV
jgi:hypothetical protein